MIAANEITPLEKIEDLYEELVASYGEGTDREIRAASKLLMIALLKLKERGALIRGKSNGGGAAYVQAVPGSIGYVQYSYAHFTNMQMASLQNQAGKFV